MILRILQNPSKFLGNQIEKWDGKQWIEWNIKATCIALTQAKIKRKDEFIWLAGEYLPDKEYHPAFAGDPVDWDDEDITYPFVYWMDSFTAYF